MQEYNIEFGMATSQQTKENIISVYQKWYKENKISFGSILRRLPFWMIEMLVRTSSTNISVTITFVPKEFTDTYPYMNLDYTNYIVTDVYFDNVLAYKINNKCSSRNSQMLALKALVFLFRQDKIVDCTHTYAMMDISTPTDNFIYSKRRNYTSNYLWTNTDSLIPLCRVSLTRQKPSLIQRIRSIFSRHQTGFTYNLLKVECDA